MRFVQFFVAGLMVVASPNMLFAKSLLTKEEGRVLKQYVAAARGEVLAKVCQQLTGNHASDSTEFSRRAKELKQQIPAGVTSLHSHPQGIRNFRDNMLRGLRPKHQKQQARLCKKKISELRRAAKMR